MKADRSSETSIIVIISGKVRGRHVKVTTDPWVPTLSKGFEKKKTATRLVLLSVISEKSVFLALL